MSFFGGLLEQTRQATKTISRKICFPQSVWGMLRRLCAYIFFFKDLQTTLTPAQTTVRITYNQMPTERGIDSHQSRKFSQNTPRGQQCPNLDHTPQRLQPTQSEYCFHAFFIDHMSPWVKDRIVHKHIYGVLTAATVMSGNVQWQRTFFGRCKQLEPTVGVLCRHLDGNRIVNKSKIGDGHRVTDYKVDCSIKLAMIRILAWNIGTTLRPSNE